MPKLLNQLWQDDYGVILSAEIVIVGSLLVVGLITGLTCLQEAVNGELRDVAGAIGALDQSYSFSAHRKAGFHGQCCAYTAGSAFANCENQKGDCCHDIAGSENSSVVAAVVTAQTEQSHCCEGSLSGSGCAGCGGAACASGAFIGSADGDHSRSLETGVPGMRVSEWHSAPASHPGAASGDAESQTDTTSALGIGTQCECVPECATEDNSIQRRHDVIIPSHVW